VLHFSLERALAKEWFATMDPEIAGLSDIKPVPFAGHQVFFL
jgi:hypothetical protein